MKAASSKMLVVMAALSMVLFFTGESWAPCGNGYLDLPQEECDLGAPGPGPGYPCPNDAPCIACQCQESYCGDGNLDSGEECEVGYPCAEHYICGEDCLCDYVPYCGDGILDSGEQCEAGVPCADESYTCDEATCTCTPPPGDEGCTPGFWRQEQHWACWSGYTAEQLFDAVFGVDFTIMWSERGKPQPVTDPTLLQALWANGGGESALARHGTAALLNAANDGVNFPLSVAEVIAAVQAGDVSALEDANELGCPLSQCGDMEPDSLSSSGGCGTIAPVPGTKAVNLGLLVLAFGVVVLLKRAKRS